MKRPGGRFWFVEQLEGLSSNIMSRVAWVTRRIWVTPTITRCHGPSTHPHDFGSRLNGRRSPIGRFTSSVGRRSVAHPPPRQVFPSSSTTYAPACIRVCTASAVGFVRLPVILVDVYALASTIGCWHRTSTSIIDMCTHVSTFESPNEFAILPGGVCPLGVSIVPFQTNHHMHTHVLL